MLDESFDLVDRGFFFYLFALLVFWWLGEEAFGFAHVFLKACKRCDKVCSNERGFFSEEADFLLTLECGHFASHGKEEVSFEGVGRVKLDVCFVNCVWIWWHWVCHQHMVLDHMLRMVKGMV